MFAELNVVSKKIKLYGMNKLLAQFMIIEHNTHLRRKENNEPLWATDLCLCLKIPSSSVYIFVYHTTACDISTATADYYNFLTFQNIKLQQYHHNTRVSCIIFIVR